MIRWFSKKIVSGFLVLLGIITLLFMIFSLLGDPVKMIVGDQSDAATEEAIKAKYHLDKSVPVQYMLYLRDLSPVSTINRNDPNFSGYQYLQLFAAGKNQLFVLKAPFMGRSFQTDRSVSEMIFERFPGTLILGITSIIFASILGIFLGTISGLKRDSWLDRLIVTLTLLGVSAPSFFVGVLLMWLLAVYLHDWTQLNVTGYMFEERIFGTGSRIVWKNLILPAIALGIRPLAIITQLTRSSMIEVLSEDYVRTAHAKGLSRFRVIFKHTLRNALNPVMTSISGWFASLLAGAFFIEYIFNWQGIGKLMIDALNKQDYPVILGCAVFIGAIFVVVSIFVDLLYAILDPRVKVAK